MDVEQVPPGGSAPASGTYEELNVLGKPTGRRVTIKATEQLPASPRGFHWRLVTNRAA